LLVTLSVHSIKQVRPRKSRSPESDLSHASDAELARALLAEDPEAYRVTWERFLPLVRSVARRTFGHTIELEDVVQEIFFCVFRRMPTLRDPVALRAFVMAIAARTVSHERRRRRPWAFAALEGEEQAAEALRVSSDPAAKHAYHGLEQLVRRLRERERRAFVLRFVEGMDAAEVAGVLGVSAPTARRSFSRAWKRINLWAGRDPFLADYLRDASNEPSAVG
jgi:RNA polymerase sigma-70 factor (ECF subfamily)